MKVTYPPPVILVFAGTRLAMRWVFASWGRPVHAQPLIASGYRPIDESTSAWAWYRRLEPPASAIPAWVLLFAVLLIALLYTGYARFNHWRGFLS